MNSYGNRLFAQEIYSIGGFAKEALSGVSVLDVGCGQRKLKGSVGMDMLANSSADIVQNVDKTPWPIEDNKFDVVLMNHVLEHVSSVPDVLREAHRVLRSGGRLVIQVPYFRSVDAFNDPTHQSFFTSGTLDYFLFGTGLSAYKYVDFVFEKKGFWFGWPHESKNWIKNALKKFIHRRPALYDQYLSLILPTECLTWELEKGR